VKIKLLEIIRIDKIFLFLQNDDLKKIMINIEEKDKLDYDSRKANFEFITLFISFFLSIQRTFYVSMFCYFFRCFL